MRALRFRFSLRTMLICLTVVLVALGWYVSSVHRQQRVVQLLKDDQWSVIYWSKMHPDAYWTRFTACLEGFVGRDWVESVVAVEYLGLLGARRPKEGEIQFSIYRIEETPPSLEALQSLSQLPHLLGVKIDHCTIRSDTLHWLGHCRSLEWVTLHFVSCKETAAWCDRRMLADLPELRRISLDVCQEDVRVTGIRETCTAGFRALEVAFFGDCVFDDCEVCGLAKLPSFRRLGLSFCTLPENCLFELADLALFVTLYVWDPDTDARSEAARGCLFRIEELLGDAVYDGFDSKYGWEMALRGGD